MASTDMAPQRKRKRARTVISCTECHRRKQKCDRQHPCGNCTLRSASHLCQYESKSNANNNSNSNNAASPMSSHDSNRSLKGESPDSPSELMLSAKDVPGGFGYIRSSAHTALNVLEKLDLDGHGCVNNWARPTNDIVDTPECVEIYAYNRHIRQIPPPPYSSLLVKVFFQECNWIYGSLHEQTFLHHMEEWFEQCASNNSPNTGKRKILSQFPALLLQVLAISLQMLPKEHYKFMAQLNLGKENFYTLSATYSNTACELASLLSASSPTLVRVQQWFLRSSWLKSEGRAVESWHALGQAIREAQEMGLHREQPRKYLNGGESYTTIWQREIEKRVWVNLYVWDRFMAMILGRPTMINDRHCNVTPPIDCQIPNDLTKSPPVPRGPLDPPNPFTERLLDYQLANIVNEIDDMEVKVDKPLSLDFSSVDLMHSKILSFTEFFPPALAIHNRDTSYDQRYPFLPAQCELLKASAFCLIVGLHRPFVFTRDRSKMELVKASLVILGSQTRVFQMTKEHHHTIYTLCFFTFDPAVLIAAVIITSPTSLDPDMIDACIEALREGHNRLEILGQRIKLAEKGAAVLKVLISKVEAAISSVHRIDNLLNRTRISSTVSESDMSSSSGASPFSTSCAQSHESPASSVSFSGSLSHSPTMMPTQLRGGMHGSPEMTRPDQMSDFDWASYTNAVVPHRDLMSMDLEEFFAMPEMSTGNLGIAAAQHAAMAHHHATQHQVQDLYAFGPGSGCAIEEQQMMGGAMGDNFWQNLLNVQFQ